MVEEKNLYLKSKVAQLWKNRGKKLPVASVNSWRFFLKVAQLTRAHSGVEVAKFSSKTSQLKVFRGFETSLELQFINWSSFQNN